MVIVCRWSWPSPQTRLTLTGAAVGIAGQPNAADVLLALAQSQFALDDAGRLAIAGQRDLRSMRADKGLVAVHRHLFGRPDGFPRRLLRSDRVEEFSVFEHFRPDAAVDAAAEVLDELAVNVLRQRLAGLAGVDRDARRLRRRIGTLGRTAHRGKNAGDQQNSERKAAHGRISVRREAV